MGPRQQAGTEAPSWPRWSAGDTEHLSASALQRERWTVIPRPHRPPGPWTKAAQRARGDSPGQSDLQEGRTEGVRFPLGTKFHTHLFMEQIAASLKCHTFQAVGWALWAVLGSPWRVPGPLGCSRSPRRYAVLLQFSDETWVGRDRAGRMGHWVLITRGGLEKHTRTRFCRVSPGDTGGSRELGSHPFWEPDLAPPLWPQLTGRPGAWELDEVVSCHRSEPAPTVTLSPATAPSSAHPPFPLKTRVQPQKGLWSPHLAAGRQPPRGQ